VAIFKKKNLIKLIGLVFFIVLIIYKINFKQFFNTIAQLNPWLLLLASFVLVIVGLFKLLRWFYILRKLQIKTNFLKIYKIFYLSLLFGTFTPLNVGEIVGKVAYLKKTDGEISSPLISIFIDRLSDIFILIALSIVGIILFLPLHQGQALLATATLLLMIVLFFLIIKTKIAQKIILKIFSIILPKKIYYKWQKQLHKILSAFQSLTFKDVILIICFTAIALFFILLHLKLIAIALNIEQIPTLYYLLIYAMTRIVMLIPITVAGFGTREISILALFSLFSVSSEVAIIFSLLLFFLGLIPTMIIGGYFWLTDPLLSKKESNQSFQN